MQMVSDAKLAKTIWKSLQFKQQINPQSPWNHSPPPPQRDRTTYLLSSRMNGKPVRRKIFWKFSMILITVTLRAFKATLLQSNRIAVATALQANTFRMVQKKALTFWFHFGLSGTSPSLNNSLEVLLKIKVQSCAKWFSLQRQKFPSSNTPHVYSKEFSLYFSECQRGDGDVKDSCVGSAKREKSGISISSCKQVWAWLIKGAENTTGSNEFSHYCSAQGALSPWKHHPQ